DLMIIAPLTGNSMSRMANAITDTPVLMAAKATMRNRSPVLLGIATNDALGLNGVNLMRLMNSKLIYFIQFGQDNPYKKSTSLVAKLPLHIPAAEKALKQEPTQQLSIQHSQQVCYDKRQSLKSCKHGDKNSECSYEIGRNQSQYVKQQAVQCSSGWRYRSSWAEDH